MLLNYLNRNINPDVSFETHNYNITTMENFTHFMDRIRWVILAVSHLVFFTCSHSYTDLHIKLLYVFSVMGAWKKESRWIWS